jgi:CO dehydrogenase nickel-insertion accessory protein CooC1
VADRSLLTVLVDRTRPEDIMCICTKRVKEKSIMNDKPLSGKRLGLFGKGGAGKSTVTVLLARGLREMGYSPVVFDADSSNLGLSEALGVGRGPTPLVDYFGGLVFTGGAVTCPVDDPTTLPGADLALRELSTRYQSESPTGIRLLVGGKMGELGPGAGCDGPIAKIARDVRIRGDEEHLVTLLDFKAGMEDSARGVLTGLDWVLTVVDPTTAALRMAGHLQGMLTKIREGVRPATSHLEDPGLVETAIRLFRESRVRGLAAILNRVPDSESEAYLRRQLQALGGPPVLGVLPEDRTLQQQWLRGEEVNAPALRTRIRSLVFALEELVVSQEEGIEEGSSGDPLAGLVPHASGGGTHEGRHHHL